MIEVAYQEGQRDVVAEQIHGSAREAGLLLTRVERIRRFTIDKDVAHPALAKLAEALADPLLERASVDTSFLFAPPADPPYPLNPNGSLEAIAGVSNPAGNVLGLMPHPEGFQFSEQHPQWTRIRDQQRRAYQPEHIEPQGLRIIRNIVDYANQV